LADWVRFAFSLSRFLAGSVWCGCVLSREPRSPWVARERPFLAFGFVWYFPFSSRAAGSIGFVPHFPFSQSRMAVSIGFVWFFLFPGSRLRFCLVPLCPVASRLLDPVENMVPNSRIEHAGAAPGVRCFCFSCLGGERFCDRRWRRKHFTWVTIRRIVGCCEKV
jgi:hypothetical protein